MASYACVRGKQSRNVFAPNSLIRKLVSLLAVWAVIMGILPTPTSAEAYAEWVNTWKFEAAPPPPEKASDRLATHNTRSTSRAYADVMHPSATGVRQSLSSTAALVRSLP